MALVSCYLYSKEDSKGEKSACLQNDSQGHFSEGLRGLLSITNTAYCENSHQSVATNYQYQPSRLSPTLPYRIIQPNPHLEIAFCTRTRNPIYVLEKDVLYTTIDDGDDAGNDNGRRFRLPGRNRRPDFFEEKSIPTSMRSRLSDYKNSGWDRGHMAPAADFAVNNRKLDNRIEEQLIKEQMQTFNLCNISPQDASLNRGLWSKLESWVRSTILELQQEDANNVSVLSPRQRRQVHVLTGPLWMPTHYSNVEGAFMEYRYLGIGKPPSLIAVPSHFYKVVVVVAHDKTTGTDRIEKFACFVMANRSTQSDSETNDDQFFLQDFLVPWSTLETVTGLEFFSHMVDDDFRKRADELTLAQVHRRQRQSQAPKTPSLQLLEAGTNSGGGRRQRNDLVSLEHLCKGGKCRV